MFRYWVRSIPSDFGTAFELEKINPDGTAGDTYHVNASSPQDTHCDCLGFERHGHCKHVDACRVIAARS